MLPNEIERQGSRHRREDEEDDSVFSICLTSCHLSFLSAQVNVLLSSNSQLGEQNMDQPPL